jgi:hypothetical protein
MTPPQKKVLHQGVVSLSGIFAPSNERLLTDSRKRPITVNSDVLEPMFTVPKQTRRV